MTRLLILGALSVVALILATVIQSNAQTAGSTSNVSNNDDTMNIEIRTYETAVVAKTTLGSGSYDELSNRGFRRLAGYIFGSNEQQEEIAMTSPVMMDLDASSKVMYFFMPDGYELGDLPQPNSEDVELEELTPTKMAVVRFGGWASDAKIERYKQELIKTLEARGLEHTGQFYFMGYNAPFEVTNRRNEVAVVIKN